MQYPYISNFPNSVDERTFFCDIDIDTKPLMDHYNNLIQEKKYQEANIFLSQQNNLHGYTADLFNFLEAKIFNTQEFVLNMEKYNPFHYSPSEPNIEIGEIWI